MFLYLALFNFVQTMLKYKNYVIKTCFQRGFEFKNFIIKKNFISKEKYGTVTKVKFVTKTEKLRKLSFILELW